jgi:hypothetical protein
MIGTTSNWPEPLRSEFKKAAEQHLQQALAKATRKRGEPVYTENPFLDPDTWLKNRLENTPQ